MCTYFKMKLKSVLLLSQALMILSLIPLQEWISLQSLYNTTNGYDWTWQDEIIFGPRWNFTSREFDPCVGDSDLPWQGITCNNDVSTCSVISCNIDGITLSSHSLFGIVTNAFMQLQQLKTLDVSNNALRSSIPQDISNLKLLTYLDLSYNLFDYEIPATIDHLEELEILNMSNNRLRGTLPETIGNIKKLKELNVFSNKIIGALPLSLSELTLMERISLGNNRFRGILNDTFANMMQLQYLDLSSNNIRGVIPPKLFTLPSLEYLYLNDNRIQSEITINETDIASNLFELNLAANSIGGSIPNGISSLSKLVVLDLFSNVITGCFPPPVGDMINLEYLGLSTNLISCTIPSSIGNLTKLKFLDVSFNQMTGDIPAALGKLSHLETCYLNDLLLSSTIPAEIGDMKKLKYLNLQVNQLTGFIPDSISKLNLLLDLILHMNQLSGSIPSDIDEILYLQHMSLYQNNLVGNIPNRLYLLTDMQSCRINDNFISSTIPDNIIYLQSLNVLDLSNNLLNGTIPSSIGKLKSLAFILFQKNSISGSIPTSIGSVVNLRILNLDSNCLIGPLPSQLGSNALLTAITLSNNRLSHTIPVEIVKLTNLNRFDISNNCISGSIPPSLGSDLRRLKFLILKTNRITNCIPQSFIYLQTLQSLYLSQNLFSQTIPSELGSLLFLTLLDLFSNQLTGSIPTEIYNIKDLRSLNLFDNRLDGSISSAISNMKVLETILLQDNLLSGTIPSTLEQLSTLYFFRVSKNLLTGTIPANMFASVTVLQFFDIENNNINGIIPINWGSYCDIRQFHIGSNLIDGTIPSKLFSCSKLTELLIFDNCLRGTIPSNIAKLELLSEFNMYGNAFYGVIPSELYTLTSLKSLDISENNIEGKISPSIGQLSSLVELDLSSNMLVGNLITQLGDLTGLEKIYLSNNALTGSFPVELCGLPSLLYLALANNLLTGSVPSCMYQLSSLVELDVSHNEITRSLPDEISTLSNLVQLLVNNNKMSGDIINIFSSNIFSYLSVLDISSNAFTGTIPNMLFMFPSITRITLSVNCFRGSLPESICSSTSSLQSLSIDALTGSENCDISRNFLGHRIPESFQGSVPECLFQIMTLTSLHIAGNGLTGEVYELPANSSLVDVRMSHNRLKGTIPGEYRDAQFSYLDLSYNRISGGWNSVGGKNASSMSLVLKSNRLTGEVSTTFDHGSNTIEVLAGNMFQCSTRDELPDEDPDKDNVSCGSSEIENSFVVFVFLFAAFISVVLIIIGHLKDRKKKFIKKYLFQSFAIGKSEVSEQSDVADASSHAIVYLVTFLRQQVIQLAVIACVISMIAYGILNSDIAGQSYASRRDKYAWFVTAAFLSGFVPAIALMILWLLVMTVFITFMKKLHSKYHQYIADNFSTEYTTTANEETSSLTELSSSRRIELFIGVYTLISVVLNGVYVNYILSDVSYVGRICYQVVIALVRFVGNRIFMQHAMSKKHCNIKKFRVLVIVTALNTVVIPCLVALVADPSCFLHVFIQADTVDVTYNTYTCDSYSNIPLGNASTALVCGSYQTASQSYSYHPPFIYNYQCHTSIITAFSPVYIYQLAISFAFSLALWLHLNLPKKHLSASYPVKLFLPMVYWAVSATPNELSNTPLLSPSTIILECFEHILIICVFGITCPYVSVFCFASFFMVAVQWIGATRRYKSLFHNPKIHQTKPSLVSFISSSDILDDSAFTLISFSFGTQTIVLLSSLYAGLMSLDIAAEDIGWQYALLYLGFALVVAIYLVVRVGRWPTNFVSAQTKASEAARNQSEVFLNLTISPIVVVSGDEYLPSSERDVGRPSDVELSSRPSSAYK